MVAGHLPFPIFSPVLPTVLVQAVIAWSYASSRKCQLLLATYWFYIFVDVSSQR